MPLVPFFIFTGQVLNWLITVVEGVAAAPFLAFAHFDTDGEGLGHKTQYGYTFMLSSFMRPVMLVLGFVVATITLEVIGGFTVNMYADVIANAQIDSMTGLFSMFGFVAILFIMMITLTNATMSITYILPDAIFNFIGAHASATAGIGRDQDGAIKNSFMGGAGAGNAAIGSVSRMAQTRKTAEANARAMKGKGGSGVKGTGTAGGN